MKTKKFRRIPAILSITLLVVVVALTTVALALPSGAEPTLSKNAKITFYDVSTSGKVLYSDSPEDTGENSIFGYDPWNDTSQNGDLTWGTAKNLKLTVTDTTYVVSSLPTRRVGGTYFSFYALGKDENEVIVVGREANNFGPSNSIILEPDVSGKYTIDSDALKKIPGISDGDVTDLYVKAVNAYTVTLPESSADFTITDGENSARLSGAKKVVDYNGSASSTYTFQVTSNVDGKTPVVGVEYGDGQYKVLTEKDGKYEITNDILKEGNVKVLVSLRDPITVTYTGGEGSQYTVTPTEDTLNPHQLSYGVKSFTVDIQGNATVRSEYTIDEVTAVDAAGKKLKVEGQGNGKYTISAAGEDASITSNVTVTVKTTEKAKTFTVTVTGENFPENVSVTGLKENGTTVSYGSSVTFSVTPSDGYTQPVVTYKVGDSNDAITLSPTGTTYTISNVTNKIEVTISDPEQIKLTVSKNLPDGVTVTVVGEDNGQISYTKGEVKVTLTLDDAHSNATPRMTVNGSSVTLNKGEEKNAWTVSLSSVTSDLVIVVPEVAINTYTVTDKNTSSVKNYTLEFTSSTTLTHGSTTDVTFKVTPALGYTVSSVKVNGTPVNGNSSSGYTHHVDDAKENLTIEVEVTASYTVKLTSSYSDDGKIVWSAELTFTGVLAKTKYKVTGVGLFFGKDKDAIESWGDYKTDSHVGNYDNADLTPGYVFVDKSDKESATVAYFCHVDGKEYSDPTYSFEYRIKDSGAARSAVLYFEIVIDGQTMTIFTDIATYQGN